MSIVTMLGAGAFGSAMAHLLARNGHTVKLWCYEEDVAACIKADRTNVQYLPDIVLSENIIPTLSLEDALSDTTHVFEAIPVPFLRAIIKQSKPFVRSEQAWITLSKGIEQATLMLPSQILCNIFGSNLRVAALGGPNFAIELGRELLSGATVASHDADLARSVSDLLASKTFKVYLSDDLIGVQALGALKNVVALAVGMARGAGCGENTIGLVFSQALLEMATVVELLGGKRETLFTLAGVGDLVLSSMGSKGRNLKAGIMFGEGKTLEDLKEAGITAEGVNTAASLFNLLRKRDIPSPLFRGVYRVIYDQKPFESVLEDFMKA